MSTSSPLETCGDTTPNSPRYPPHTHARSLYTHINIPFNFKKFTEPPAYPNSNHTLAAVADSATSGPTSKPTLYRSTPLEPQIERTASSPSYTSYDSEIESHNTAALTMECFRDRQRIIRNAAISKTFNVLIVAAWVAVYVLVVKHQDHHWLDKEKLIDVKIMGILIPGALLSGFAQMVDAFLGPAQLKGFKNRHRLKDAKLLPWWVGCDWIAYGWLCMTAGFVVYVALWG